MNTKYKLDREQGSESISNQGAASTFPGLINPADAARAWADDYERKTQEEAKTKGNDKAIEDPVSFFISIFSNQFQDQTQKK